jgi:hypothetical protein
VAPRGVTASVVENTTPLITRLQTMNSACQGADARPIVRDRYTIVTPWLSATDWTSVITGYFIRLLGGPSAVSVVTGQSTGAASGDGAEDPFAFLDAKLAVSVKLREAARNGTLAARVLLVDSNFVNLRALRTMVGDKGWIVTLVNGGAFQPHDFDHQSLPSWVDRIAAYEGAMFALCDRIVLASTHARTMFLDRFPTLASRVATVPYPVRSCKPRHWHVTRKAGAIFASRPSYEKGVDVVDALVAMGWPVTRVHRMPPDEYLAELRRHLCVLVPARAELFGYLAIEAVQAGTIPIVPNGLSYREFLELPDWLFLSHPVGVHTVAEIDARLSRLQEMSTADYAAIVERARAHLERVLHGQGDRFRSALEP